MGLRVYRAYRDLKDLRDLLVSKEIRVM